MASRKLPHHFGFFGAAEIEAIGGGDGARAGSGNVARGFGDGVHGAEFGIELAPAAIAIGGEREGAQDTIFLGLLDAHDGGIAGAGSGERIGADAGVVLLGDPVLRGDGGRGEESFEIGGEIGFFGGEVEPVFFGFGARRGRGDVAIIDGTLFGKRMRGNFARRLCP